MKYTFQDSTDFPVQRDFIKDVQDFLKLTAEIVPFERSARLHNDEKQKSISSTEAKTEGIGQFEKGILSSIGEQAVDLESMDLSDVINDVQSSISAISSRKKAELEKQLENDIKSIDYELDQLNSKMLSVLEPFFLNGVYADHSKYVLSSEDGIISGIQTSTSGNIEYVFNLEFSSNTLKVNDFIKKISLPVWSTGGILRREDKVKKIDISDHRIVSVEYDDDMHLEVLLQNNDSVNIFRIISDKSTFMVFHNGTDITQDVDLARAMDKENILLLIKKLSQYFTVAVQSHKLASVLLDGEDAIKNNTLQRCLELIAEKYGALINECLSKGYNKEEIAIKIELPDGTRSEKYILRSELYNQLSEVGDEGISLAKIMNVSDS
ncbi:hypothetical protein [Methanolobus vulcani]|uniref:Chromosome segregation ATPase n=1 Tax=Methanolobus vulcani TaxID=38026 RepID=A0A7Z8KPN6_9EURY|nr:hypothetical protein [Methanolobus vulcani]TQD26434.1 hypothetical protein FKV42_06740 [Methanolobus vulcani]